MVTHGRATRAISASEARANASSRGKYRAMMSPRMLLTVSAARRSTSSPLMARLRLADPADRAKIASGNAEPCSA